MPEHNTTQYSIAGLRYPFYIYMWACPTLCTQSVKAKFSSEFGLDIKWKKCKFLKEKIEYLGYEIKNNRISIAETKIAAVKKYPEPRTIKQIQSFLGFTGYFRKFIPNYSQIAKPLSDLLKKNSKFIFEEAQRKAYELLKTSLIQRPVLNIYSPENETELHTDACKHGYGAVLLQKDNDDGKLHPIYYMSRKTTDAEQKYASYELEVLAIVEALKKFRVYLLGIPFKIVTDCSAFKMTMNKKELATRVARWALLLEEFSYTIEHRPGVRMKHVDALSRNPQVNIVEAVVTNRIRKAQQEDEELMTIMKILETSSHDGYFIKNQLLYKEYKDSQLLVIPRRMQTEIIKAAHQNGHFAARKTLEIILRDYWFAKMKEKVDAVIRNCISCILHEKKAGKQEGMLNPIDKGDSPLATYHVDHLGPLASSKKGYKYVLAVVDAFTKFVWIYATKTTSTEEAISKLEIQRIVFGNPHRVITDKGSTFKEVFNGYCQENNIQHVQITTGVPRGNGQIERINRIIIPVLSKLSIENPENWYKHIGNLQVALNSTFQRSIGRTPFELMIGTKMKTAQDIKLQQIITEESIALFEEERDSLRRDAKKQIAKIQEENRRNFNKKRKPAHQYQIGDLVAIKRTQFITIAKLKPKYLGPYKIISVTGKDRYEVEKVGSGEGPKRTSTTADHMKPWVSNESDYEDDHSSDSSETDENQDGRDVGLSNPVHPVSQG